MRLRTKLGCKVLVIINSVEFQTDDLLQPFFVERVFQIFDKDDSGSISFQEFIDAIHQFAGQTPEDKIKFLFKVYDIDGKMKSDSILLHIRRGVEVNIFIIVNILFYSGLTRWK